MNKIPMQIYMDSEDMLVFKQLAKEQGLSFSESIRQAVKNELRKKKKLINKPKEKKFKYKKFFEKAAFIREKHSASGYSHSNKTDDELIYGL